MDGSKGTFSTTNDKKNNEETSDKKSGLKKLLAKENIFHLLKHCQLPVGAKLLAFFFYYFFFPVKEKQRH